MIGKFVQYSMQKQFRSLLIPVDRMEFVSTPSEPNAYYAKTRNGLWLLAALLQPYFETALPSFYTYAAVGSIIGHEITHGFDDTGYCVECYPALYTQGLRQGL
ncbi:CBN-NEP-1 protein [Aphelenchoides avenae]|nr:CBN-NEP-1 protein [Aphelenchus avenae]